MILRADARGMFARTDAAAGRFHAHEFHLLVLDEWEKYAGRIASAAYAGDDHIRQTSGLLQYLLAGFFADYTLKIPDHGRVGVRPGG